jgi:hypothetical protein
MSLVQRKVDGLLRYGLAHGLSGVRPFYIVNEYPKSGGTWVGQMLGRILDLPFPRNRLPGFGPAILHGHHLRPGLMRNVAVVWRDGRDVMVSWYYHCLFNDHPANVALRNIVRGDLAFSNYEDVRANLPAFIEYAFTRQKHPRFTWAQFVDIWHVHPACRSVRYESLRLDPVGEMSRLVHALTGRMPDREVVTAAVEEFSFERQSGRAPGHADARSFLRKGVVGEWQSVFSAEAREIFDRFAGDQLVRIGYEKDRAWVGVSD